MSRNPYRQHRNRYGTVQTYGNERESAQKSCNTTNLTPHPREHRAHYTPFQYTYSMYCQSFHSHTRQSRTSPIDATTATTATSGPVSIGRRPPPGSCYDDGGLPTLSSRAPGFRVVSHPLHHPASCTFRPLFVGWISRFSSSAVSVGFYVGASLHALLAGADDHLLLGRTGRGLSPLGRADIWDVAIVAWLLVFSLLGAVGVGFRNRCPD